MKYTGKNHINRNMEINFIDPTFIRVFADDDKGIPARRRRGILIESDCTVFRDDVRACVTEAA